MEENIEKKSYLELVNGDIPPWVMRFVKGAGKAINRYNMIKEGDEVLLAVSGGKDSLALALALSLRLKWLPVQYIKKILKHSFQAFSQTIILAVNRRRMI